MQLNPSMFDILSNEKKKEVCQAYERALISTNRANHALAKFFLETFGDQVPEPVKVVIRKWMDDQNEIMATGIRETDKITGKHGATLN